MSKCDFCGTDYKVYKIRGTEKYQCRACYVKMLRHDEARFLVCVDCGKLGYAEYRNDQNEPLCQSCHYRAKSTCYVCGKKGTFFDGRCKDCHEGNLKRLKNCSTCRDLFAFRYDSTTECPRCRSKRKHQKRGFCESCHKPRELTSTPQEGKKVCIYCYKKYYMPHTPCEMCGEITFCFNNYRIGKSICVRCSNIVRAGYRKGK